MGSFAEEEIYFRPVGIERQSSKPAVPKILCDDETKPEPVRSLSERNKSRYHAYSRWINRRATKVTSRLKLTDIPDPIEICDQGKLMCQEYIFNRLKKQNLLHIAGRTGPVIQSVLKTTDISAEILTLGNELEKTYPDLYTNVSKQLQVTLQSSSLVKKNFMAVAEHMVINQQTITWGKVIALFALAGGFAQDCVQQGHPDFISTVLDTFEAILEKYVATWIAKQGGWADVVRTFRTSSDTPTIWALSIFGALLGFAVTMLATTQL